MFVNRTGSVHHKSNRLECTKPAAKRNTATSSSIQVSQLGANGTDVGETLLNTSALLGDITSAKEAAQVIQSLSSVLNSIETDSENEGDTDSVSIWDMASNYIP